MFPNALSPRVALLIDADNIQLSHAEQITKLAHYFGQVTICRAYGDWKIPPLSDSYDHVWKLKIDCVQVDRIAAQATDRQLISDADKMLGADGADVFIIASGDVHFRPLCERVKHKRLSVIGIGTEGKTSSRLREACNKFYYVEHLQLILLLFRAFHSIRCDKEGWLDRGLLGNKLRELDPNFKQRFGSKKLSEWLRNLSDWVETKGQMVRVIDREVFEVIALLRGV